MSHLDHETRLARLEEALAAGRDPDRGLLDQLAGCGDCAAMAARLTDTARRLRTAALMLDLDVDPPAAVRARVKRAALGTRSVDPESSRPRGAPSPRWRLPAGLLPRIGWAGTGAMLGAFTLAVALTFAGLASTPVAAFELAGSGLAPGATGVAQLRPLPGGSVGMTLTIRGLPPSRPGEFYELWWVGPEKRHVSCGTFRSDGSPVDLAFTAGVDVNTTVLIEITLEKDDGDAAPGPHVAQ